MHKLVVGVVEDDQCNLAITEYTELVGLLHEAMLSLQKCNLSVTVIGNGLNSDLFAAHSMLTKRGGISAIHAHMSIQRKSFACIHFYYLGLTLLRCLGNKEREKEKGKIEKKNGNSNTDINR